jgi:hypothetical protein
VSSERRSPGGVETTESTWDGCTGWNESWRVALLTLPTRRPNVRLGDLWQMQWQVSAPMCQEPRASFMPCWLPPSLSPPLPSPLPGNTPLQTVPELSPNGFTRAPCLSPNTGPDRLEGLPSHPCLASFPVDHGPLRELPGPSLAQPIAQCFFPWNLRRSTLYGEWRSLEISLCFWKSPDCFWDHPLALGPGGAEVGTQKQTVYCPWLSRSLLLIRRHSAPICRSKSKGTARL